jgi:hypothetical protein
MPFLLQTINEIKEKIDTEILILGRVPQFSPHPNIVFRDLQKSEEINSVAWARQYNIPGYEDSTLHDIAIKTHVHFISKSEIICPNQNCKILIDSTMGYVDSQHWSIIGMKYYGSLLISHKVFEELIRN